MTGPPAPRPVPGVERLRERLVALGFTREGIRERLGAAGDVLAREAELPVRLRRVGDADALALLLRALVLGAPLDDARARALLPAEVYDALTASGVLDLRGDELHAVARIVPHYDDVLVAADNDEQASDWVPGVQRPSGALADLTVRRPVDRALDLGTGSGVQALLLSRHARHVVATDVSDRALAYARFNLALNGVANVELRQGSFFEPVAGETFDLVVSNPPYVISPETAYVFRDSGLAGGRVAERLLRELPAYLNEGGFASALVSWVLNDDPLTAAPQAWLEGSGCDAWLLYTSVDEPLESAAVWNATKARDPEAYAAAVDEWLAYYEREGIRSLAYAAVLLRKRSGDNWLRAQTLPSERTRAAPHVERLFAAQDVLAGRDDEGVLDLRVALVPQARLDQSVRVGAGEWVLDACHLRLVEGIGFRAELDSNTLAIVRRLDGDATLREVADAVAAEVEASPADARAATVRLAKQMLELGFVAVAT